MKRTCSFEMPTAAEPFDVPQIDSEAEFARWCKYELENRIIPCVRTETEVKGEPSCLKDIHEPLDPLPKYAFKFLEQVEFSYIKFGEANQYDRALQYYHSDIEKRANAVVKRETAHEAMKKYFEGGAKDFGALKELSNAFIAAEMVINSSAVSPFEMEWLQYMRPLYEAAMTFFCGYINGVDLLVNHVQAEEKSHAKEIWDKVAALGNWPTPYSYGPLTKVQSVSPGDFLLYSHQTSTQCDPCTTRRCYVLFQSRDPLFWWVAVYTHERTFKLTCVREICLFEWLDPENKPKW